MADTNAQVLAQRLPSTAPNPGWTTRTTVASFLSAAAVSTDGTRIYRSHGLSNGSNSVSYASVWDPAGGGAFSNTTNFPNTMRAYTAGTFAGGRHWSIGGANGATVNVFVEAYLPAGTGGVGGTWTSATDLPAGRVGASAATVGSFLYVAGGTSTASGSAPVASTASGSAYRYDTSAGTAGTWVQITSLPAARYGGALVSVGTKLFYLGGYDNTGASVRTVYVYDTTTGTTGTWSTATALTVSVSGCGGTVVGSSVYLVSGGLLAIYDTTTGTTRSNILSPPSAPAPADHGTYPGIAAIGSTVYAVSGSGTANVDALDTSAVTLTTAPGWNTLAALPATRYGAATSTDGTNVYTSHGNAGGALVATGATITAAGAVTAMSTSATPARAYTAGVWCNGRHWAIGGSNSATVYFTTQGYAPAGTNGAAGTWSAGPNLSTAITGAAAAAVGNYIYLAGGSDTASGSTPVAATARNTFYRYNTVNAGGSWEDLSATAPLPAARTQGALVTYSGKLYHLGGLDTTGSSTRTVYVYDPTPGTWSTSGAVMPFNGDGAATAATVSGGVFVYTGSGNLTSTFNGSSFTATAAFAVPTSHGTSVGAVGIGSTFYLVSGSGTANVDTLDTAAVAAGTLFARRVKAVQQYLAGSDPTGFALSRRLPLTVPAQATWATIGALPAARYAAAVSTDGANVYVTHGIVNSAAVATGSSVTQAGIVSSFTTNDAVALQGAAGVWASGRHYVFGWTGSGTTSSVRYYVPAGTNGAAGTWASGTDLPAQRAWASVATIDGRFVYLAGGQTDIASSNRAGASASFYRYDTVNNTWTTLTAAPLPAARTQGVMVVWNGKLLYLGGRDPGGTESFDIYVYDPTSGTWSTSTRAAVLAPTAAAIVGRDIYVTQGTSVWRQPADLSAAATNAGATPVQHGGFPGAVAIGNALYVVSGAGTANVDRIDPVSATNYVRDVRNLRAVLTA